MKLRLGLQRVDKIVFGRVLGQDESLCGVEDIVGGGKIVKEIESAGCPELCEDVLFIRGCDTENDNDWFAHAYETYDVAKQAVKDIKMLVAKINGHASEEVEDCGLEIIE